MKSCPTKIREYVMYVQRNVDAPSRNHCCCGKAISITYFCVYVCVSVFSRTCVGTWKRVSTRSHVALIFHNLTPIRDIVGGVSTTSFEIMTKMARLSEKSLILIFSTILSEIFLILRRIQRDIAINVKTFLFKVPVILIRL